MTPPRRRGRAAAGALAAAVLGACAPAAPPPPPAAPPPPATVRAAVDRATASTGDLVTYSVDVEHAAGVTVELPEPTNALGGLRIVDAGRTTAAVAGNRRQEHRWYRLRADLTGSFVLPPLHATVRPATGGGAPTALSTDEIFVKVESVLPADGSAQDIRDIHPLRRPPRRPLWPWAVAAAVAVAGLCGAAAWAWRRGRRPPAPPPEPPPHAVALAQLAALRPQAFPDAAACQRYYVALSEVVRRYIEARFAINATDLTSEELSAWAAGAGGLTGALRGRLIALLGAADGVKFARAQPDVEATAALFEHAVAFVEATRPPDPSAAAPPPPAAG